VGVIAGLGWRLAVPVVLAASGVLFVTSAQTAHGTDLRTGGRTKLSDLVVEQQQRNARLAAQVARARGSVDSLTAGLSLDPRLTSQVTALNGPAGLVAARGPGIRVSLDDAPPLAPGAQRPSWLTADDLVVHQQDLQAVVNALWHGGAEAVQVMDQRIVSTSAVRCVGNTLILQGRVYSPPFVVTAIGDRRRLRAALDHEPGVQLFKEYVHEAGLRWSDRDLRDVTVPAFDGAVDLMYARPGS
jgi:uncharacterized protein YlxW (UPF0749 family)